MGISIAVQEQSTAMFDGLIPFEIDVLRDNLGVRCVDGTAEGACSISLNVVFVIVVLPAAES